MTNYKDYITFLRGPKSDALDLKTWKPGPLLQSGGKYVADRFFYCEIPYAKIFRKEERTQFSLKQWHNMHFSTMSFNPLIILSTRKSSTYQDAVPEDLFEPILKEYRELLDDHYPLNYYNYDFETDSTAAYLEMMLQVEEIKRARSAWWLENPSLYGAGNTVSPTVFIMAQDLGPSNVHRLPFEQGPSGYYLSEVLDGKPLDTIYLTNWIKDHNDMGRNVDLLRSELEHLRPTHVILLGREAEASVPILDAYVAHTNVHSVVHPGWVVNHGGSIPEVKRRKLKFEERWNEIWTKILPTL